MDSTNNDGARETPGGPGVLHKDSSFEIDTTPAGNALVARDSLRSARKKEKEDDLYTSQAVGVLNEASAFLRVVDDMALPDQF